MVTFSANLDVFKFRGRLATHGGVKEWRQLTET